MPPAFSLKTLFFAHRKVLRRIPFPKIGSNRMSRPKKKHAQVDPRKKTISMPNNRVQNLDAPQRKISIPKRRLRQPDISMLKKRCTHQTLTGAKSLYLGGLSDFFVLLEGGEKGVRGDREGGGVY